MLNYMWIFIKERLNIIEMYKINISKKSLNLKISKFEWLKLIMIIILMII